MSLPPFTKALAEKKLSEFCERRVPPHIRDKVRLTFEIRGDTVTLIEEREPWREDMTEWTRMPIARLKYVEKTNRWMVYCADRRERWHKYLDSALGLDEALYAIDKDKTGIFWG